MNEININKALITNWWKEDDGDHGTYYVNQITNTLVFKAKTSQASTTIEAQMGSFSGSVTFEKSDFDFIKI